MKTKNTNRQRNWGLGRPREGNTRECYRVLKKGIKLLKTLSKEHVNQFMKIVRGNQVCNSRGYCAGHNVKHKRKVTMRMMSSKEKDGKVTWLKTEATSLSCPAAKSSMPETSERSSMMSQPSKRRVTNHKRWSCYMSVWTNHYPPEQRPVRIEAYYWRRPNVQLFIVILLTPRQTHTLTYKKIQDHRVCIQVKILKRLQNKLR